MLRTHLAEASLETLANDLSFGDAKELGTGLQTALLVRLKVRPVCGSRRGLRVYRRGVHPRDPSAREGLGGCNAWLGGFLMGTIPRDLVAARDEASSRARKASMTAMKYSNTAASAHPSARFTSVSASQSGKKVSRSCV